MNTRHDELSLQLPTRRDLVRPLFQYSGAVAGTFVCVVALTIAVVALQPRLFTAEMKILVKRERVDTVMTLDPRVTSVPPVDDSETELYSEIELLRSRDLLERVVVDTGLHVQRQAAETPAGGAAASLPRRVAGAVRLLRANLTVEPVRRTRFISVSYRDPDARMAVRVLDRLAARYLEKHLEVHRAAGAYDFFTDQALRLQQELRSAEQRLTAFTEHEDVVSAAAEKTATLHSLGEFQMQLEQAQAAKADADRRLLSIEAESAATPARHVTAVRDTANVDLVRELRAGILQREITLHDMLQKFTPTYPPVVRLEEELDQLRAALSSAQEAPLRDETTDQNPTYQWLRNEAARVRTERDALVARAAAIQRTIDAFRQRARRLESAGLQQQDLLLALKTAEENYSLYRRKQEEARISDALDRTRITNVVLAEPPVVPLSATRSRRGTIVMAGGLLAVVLSLGVAYVSHAFNPRFRSPDEVCQVLDVPVLAALPAAAE
jgi:uncharacterized protein involved in exopolysaccharide biosynthesis